MKNKYILILSIASWIFYSCNDNDSSSSATQEHINNDNHSSSSTTQEHINWVDLPTAEALAAKDPRKKILMMFYTTWCSYCKKAKSTTLKDAEVVKHIGKNFIPVMIDAETKTTVIYQNKEYPYSEDSKTNEFTYFMLGEEHGYPSFLIIDKGKKTNILEGYLPAPDFLRFETIVLRWIKFIQPSRWASLEKMEI